MDKGEYKNMFLTAEAQGLACCAAKRWRVGYRTIRVEIIYSARCRIPKWHMWGGGTKSAKQLCEIKIILKYCNFYSFPLPKVS